MCDKLLKHRQSFWITLYIPNKMQRYTVYFIWKLLYMFRVVPSPIIRSANNCITASGICHTVIAICRCQLELVSTNCIYSVWYLLHRYYYLPLSWKSWNRFECAVGGVRHPQHTQTGFSSSTKAADSSNGLTNTRCCRYSCLRSWWWVEVPPETCRAVSR